MGSSCTGERDRFPSSNTSTKMSSPSGSQFKKSIKSHHYRTKKVSFHLDRSVQRCIRTIRGSITDLYRLGSPVKEAENPTFLTAVHIVTNQQCALQEFRQTDKCRKDPNTSLPTEVELSLSLDHPNILQIHEVLKSEESHFAVFESVWCVLASRWECFGPRNVDAVGRVMIQIMKALQYTHKLALVHKNLNLTTIALKESDVDSLTVKVFGFGASPQAFSKEKLKHSPYFHYIAPELFLGEVTEKCDIWSCGVMMHVLITSVDVLQRTHTQKTTFPKTKWLYVRSDVQSLVKQMMARDPRNRPTADEFLRHPWIKQLDTSLSSKSKEVRAALRNLHSKTRQSAIKETIASFILKGFYPQSELTMMTDVFLAIDCNKDWHLTRDELAKALGKLMPDHKVDLTIDQIMAKCDIEGKGFISYSDFLLAAVDKKAIFSSENIVKVFNCLDRDNSGWISVEELKEAFVVYAPAQDVTDQWKKALQEVDRSQNGQLEFSEFEGLCLRV